MKKNICVISQAPLSYSETFIQAHIDRLDANIFHLYGYYLNHSFEGTPLREKYKKQISLKDRIMHLLPYYIVFRIKQNQQKDYKDERIVERFFIENDIKLVLAEYGTTGSFITPVCKKLNIPLFVHFHGFDASRFNILKEFRDQYKIMFEYASYVISVSHFMTQSLINLGCSQEKIIYNPYGPNPIFYDASPNYNSNNIIAVGRFVDKKAPYLTITAFRNILYEYPELKLIMVGDGPLLNTCKNLARSWEVEDRVNFPGALSHDLLLNLISESFCFIQHSVVADDGDTEGTPVAILEAGAAGLPVIATKHAGIPDVVDHEKTGFLVDEFDVKEMANYIKILANDRGKAKIMGNKAREHILKNFSIEKHIAALDNLIANVLSKE